MIPVFPNFKKLELSDKDDVEKFTEKFPPYSDFNFTSMLSWDIKGEMRLSQLNNNLVVRFNDYLNGNPFYSFLGNNKINETVDTLLKLSEKEDIVVKLKLVPEDSIKSIDKKKFNIEEDRNHFDYILSVEKIKPHDGLSRKLSSRRKSINKLKQSSNVSISKIDLDSPIIVERIKKVSLAWEIQRGVKEDDARHLYQALEYTLKLGNQKGGLCLGVFIDNQLVGYTINELVNKEYAVGNFQQADIRASTALYALLMQETAAYLDEAGCKKMNLEQDLGIEGLRKWKMSYNPSEFLKKYTIVYNN